MAVSQGRVAVAALACAGFITVALLPPSPDAPGTGFGVGRPRSRLDQLTSAVAQVARRVEALELRDELRARLRRSPVAPGSPPVLWLDPGVPAEMAARIRAGWDTLLSRFGPVHPQSALVVVVRQDTAHRAFAFLPHTTDGRSCVVVAVLGAPSRVFRTGMATRELLSLVGPCAYYAVFGPPGPPVERWLVNRAERTASVPQWLEQAPRTRLLGDAVVRGDADSIRARMLLDRWFDVFYRGDLDEMACAAGRPAACRGLLAAPLPAFIRQDRKLRAAGILNRTFAFAPWYQREVDYFLSDLVRDEGAERFARFWRATDSAEVAFRTVYGRSPEQWATEWLRAGRDFRAGPGIRTSSVLVSLVAALVFASLAAAWTGRREVR